MGKNVVVVLVCLISLVCLLLLWILQPTNFRAAWGRTHPEPLAWIIKPRLTFGMTKQQVLDLLGPPDDTPHILVPNGVFKSLKELSSREIPVSPPKTLLIYHLNPSFSSAGSWLEILFDHDKIIRVDIHETWG